MSLAGKVAAAKAAWKGSYYAAKIYLDVYGRYIDWRERVRDARETRRVARANRKAGD